MTEVESKDQKKFWFIKPPQSFPRKKKRFQSKRRGQLLLGERNVLCVLPHLLCSEWRPRPAHRNCQKTGTGSRAGCWRLKQNYSTIISGISLFTKVQLRCVVISLYLASRSIESLAYFLLLLNEFVDWSILLQTDGGIGKPKLTRFIFPFPPLSHKMQAYM